MHHRRRRVVALGSVAIAVTSAVIGAAAPAGAHPTARFTTVVSGLNAPRGITLDARGNLYVAEAGVAGSGPAGVASGGRVSKFRPGSATARWTTGLQSIYAVMDPTQPPDVLGPAGLSTLGSSCTDGHRYGSRHHDGGDCPLLLITSESHDGLAAQGLDTTQLGYLYGLNRHTGAARQLVDVGDQDYRWTKDHPTLANDFPDADPFGVLVVRDRWSHRVRVFVADAASNTVDEVMRDGRVRHVAFIPPSSSGNDATPTCIAQGRDGMLYVGTLDLLVNFASPGQSRVYRVNPNANFPARPQLWATGLTTVTGCTFDRHGNFWATEMFAPNAAGAPGDLVRVSGRNPHRLTHVGLGTLPLPGGVAQGPDGALYVTTNTAGAPGSGAVVRVRA